MKKKHNSKWERDREHAHRKRRMIQSYKEVPCMDCKKRYPVYVMDFDHRDSTEKLLNISKVHQHGIQKLLSEIKKCDVVCSNCHRERTHQRKEAARLAQLEDAATSKVAL